MRGDYDHAFLMAISQQTSLDVCESATKKPDTFRMPNQFFRAMVSPSSYGYKHKKPIFSII